MTPVELTIGIILLLLSVPDFCAKIGRPALVYTLYLLIGILLGQVVSPKVNVLLTEIGRLGFILLLFEVGLEIDLPPAKHWWTPLKLVIKWNMIQYPLTMGIAHWTIGATWSEAFLAAVALNACAVSMSFIAWMNYTTPNQDAKKHLLLWMVSLEIVAIIIITAGGVVLKSGFGPTFFLQLLIIVLVVAFIGKFANQLMEFVDQKMPSTIRLRVHYIVLFIFVISALGGRLGLSAPKTAFFLGLFISRTTHEGIALQHHLRPVGQNLLIPMFFLALGVSVPSHTLFTPIAGYALLTTLLLLAVRDLLHRTFVKSGCAQSAFLLVCPNLTVVAIAASTLIEHQRAPNVSVWLILTGLFLSVLSIIFLPQRKEQAPHLTSVS